MAYAMTKRGSLDNCVTYEFICDTIEDMNAIENIYRTIGSIAIVLQGDSGLEVYISGSDKQWNSLSSIGGGSSDGSVNENTIRRIVADMMSDSGALNIHICSQSEIRSGKPNISAPDDKTIYLVPAEDSSNGNLYDEYIYVNRKWEKFGGGNNIDLSNYVTWNDANNTYYQKPYNGIPASDLASGVIPDTSALAPKASPVFTGSISLGRTSNTTIGNNSIAIGDSNQATGAYSHAEGSNTKASGNTSHAEGHLTEVSGQNSHAEGYGTKIIGSCAHVSGIYNVVDNRLYPTNWAPQTEYLPLSRVTAKLSSDYAYSTYICTTLHTSKATFDLDKSYWVQSNGGYNYDPIAGIHEYAEIVGNGSNNTNRSNARTLDWDGNERLRGDIYVGCNADSTGGIKLEPMPTVTTTDNGKVIEVVDGKWAKGGEKVPIVYEWLDKTWNELTSIHGKYIWTDGDNIYYSNTSSTQYILDKSTSTWNKKTWNGTNNFNGQYIWTDGDNIYYSLSNTSYVLDRSTSTWNEKTWNGLTDVYGNQIWTDGNNIYYSYNSSIQYVLDKSTSTWNKKTWIGITSMLGENIWTDGINIYYSNSTAQYVLDKSNSTWSPMIWKGLTNFLGQNVWTDGKNVYYSNNTTQYILDRSTFTWIPNSLNGLTNYQGQNIWTDGDNVYYSVYGTQKVLFIHSNLSDYILNLSKGAINGVATLDSYGKIPSNQITRIPGFISMNWNGYMPRLGENIWTDGTNIYYSSPSDSQGTNNYVLDKSTSTWNQKAWYGLTRIYGKFIWTDGTDIYYSEWYNGVSEQRVLNKADSTWEQKTWNGMTEFSGEYIWTDGDNIYYSNSSEQYVLDSSTSTWSEKTWNGSTNINGDRIWTDGNNIYYSYQATQYVLNKSTSTWYPMVWSGFTPTYASNIWTDGNNIYYDNQRILDKATSTWLPKKWNGPITYIQRSNIWNDGTNYYYSSNSIQCQLIIPCNFATVDCNGNLVDSEKSFYDFPLISPPTTDGTYTLQVIVTNGIPVYSWV